MNKRHFGHSPPLSYGWTISTAPVRWGLKCWTLGQFLGSPTPSPHCGQIYNVQIALLSPTYPLEEFTLALYSRFHFQDPNILCRVKLGQGWILIFSYSYIKLWLNFPHFKGSIVIPAISKKVKSEEWPLNIFLKVKNRTASSKRLVWWSADIIPLTNCIWITFEIY